MKGGGEVAFELDRCQVRTPAGELIANAFVREHDGTGVLVETEHLSTGWLEPGDPVVLELMSAARGVLTYDAVVVDTAMRRIELADLRLRETVQQREAVRVATLIPLRVTHVVPEDEPVPLDDPLDVVVIDLSAHGLRLRADRAVEVGTRLALRLTVTRAPVDLVAEVVRTEEGAAQHLLGCRIVGAGERTTDELFGFVMQEQRRLLAQRAEAER